MPGCENTQLVSMQPETAVRETYRIDGEYQVTHQDYVEGKVFDDALAYSFYPIDLHDSNGIVPKHLNEGTVATIPLRALIPKNSKHMMSPACISSDRWPTGSAGSGIVYGDGANCRCHSFAGCKKQNVTACCLC
jgi:hypothetical protein